MAPDNLGAKLRRDFARLRWFFRRTFWNGLAVLKAKLVKPLVIPLPPQEPTRIEPVEMSQAVDGLPVTRVLVARQCDIPPDEREFKQTLFYRFQVWLYRAYSPMQEGLPPIDPDPLKALDKAYTRAHRKQFMAPVLPAEYLGSPDLGALAVRGPYVVYTQKVDGKDGAFEWDVSSLAGYATRPGLRRLGARVHFAVDARRRALVATRITTAALGETTPADSRWELAKQIALCSVTTHASLVRHFNWVHLAGGGMFAIATRNTLPGTNPLMRLLFPYMYATQQGNDMVSRGQMLEGGDFDSCFSFTFAEQCRLFGDTWDGFDIVHNDPAEYARRRGVTRADGDAGFATPTERNLAQLFERMLDHAERYLGLYWPSDEVLAKDRAVLDWIDALNRLVPNGVGVTSETLTLATLARLVARLIYLATAQHELLGSFLWNYQLWTHRQPVRVYANGQREPLDVYQRLVNANFNLNVGRRALNDDFSYMALDTEGAAEMRRFANLLMLDQQQAQKSPWVPWRLYPAELKVNINA